MEFESQIVSSGNPDSSQKQHASSAVSPRQGRTLAATTVAISASAKFSGRHLGRDMLVICSPELGSSGSDHQVSALFGVPGTYPSENN
jgi:hypothetical protein